MNVNKKHLVIPKNIALLMDREPQDEEVLKLIAQHHKYINDNFYTCTIQIYSGLADLYVEDSRFTAYYENIKSDLAKYMHDAMKIYCGKNSKDKQKS
ncbi:MAG: TipAS antibiotic-recognition domain-containing protein [Halanaerobiales bacterium]|nr:TipAS antibiotic-recognition domain-containing protein [Halanaerobiales bacterium]